MESPAKLKSSPIHMTYNSNIKNTNEYPSKTFHFWELSLIRLPTSALCNTLQLDSIDGTKQPAEHQKPLRPAAPSGKRALKLPSGFFPF